MTPSFIGLMATTFPGVRPSMSLASIPCGPSAPQSPDRKIWSGGFVSKIPPLWNYNRHRLGGCAPPPVLPDDHNRIAPPAEGLREVSEMAVGPDIGHLLPVNQQGCAGFGAAHHLDDIAVQLRAFYIEQHFLALALSHQSELVRITGLACVLVRVDGNHIPQLSTRIHAGHFAPVCSGV